MEHYCKFVQEAGERGLSKDEVEGELDRVVKVVMKAATEWKMTCELEGTALPSLSSGA